MAGAFLFPCPGSDDHKCLGWVREILSEFKSNMTHLHFSDLWDWKKAIACKAIATKPCRYFIVASNKRNIEDYKNAAAQRTSRQAGTAWLYWFFQFQRQDINRSQRMLLRRLLQSL
jgi:hypothetical protein